MKRGLSPWQLPLLMRADRFGHWFLERIKNRNLSEIEAALTPVVAKDAVFCTDAQQHMRASQKRPEWCIMS